jgi:hypothetical protein
MVVRPWWGGAEPRTLLGIIPGSAHFIPDRAGPIPDLLGYGNSLSTT